jgi:DNA invertase Pin-like site-specific DNA recombinase
MAALLLSVLGVFVGFERALIRERQLEGIALAEAPRRLHRPQTSPHPPAGLVLPRHMVAQGTLGCDKRNR